MEEYSPVPTNNPSLGLSDKQKSFVIITQVVIWLSFVIIVAVSGVLIYYITNNLKTTKNAIDKFNNISVIDNYLKNPTINITDECVSFDGHTFTFKSPILLSDNAKSNIQFEKGLNVNGMLIDTVNPIQFNKPILFENNMYVLNRFVTNSIVTPPSFVTAISASSNNLFFGNPGRTEISSVDSSTLCTLDSTPGLGNHPFPGFYVRTGTINKLCLCMANWVYRTLNQTFNTYQFAFPGSTGIPGTYNTRGEYCVNLS